MPGVAVIVFSCLVALPASNATTLDLGVLEPIRLSWDLNLEGGLGSAPPTLFALGRLRAGLLVYQGPWYGAVGVTYEISTLALAAIGVQGEILHLGTGLWAQLGGALSTRGQPSAMFAFGWSLVGIEGEWRAPTLAGPNWVILGKLRIPVALIVMAIQR
jgi:hypothetical protein